MSRLQPDDLLIDEMVQLMIKQFCLRPLQFTLVQRTQVLAVSIYQFWLTSVHNSKTGMNNFASRVFPQQILFCSDRGKRKSKDLSASFEWSCYVDQNSCYTYSSTGPATLDSFSDDIWQCVSIWWVTPSRWLGCRQMADTKWLFTSSDVYWKVLLGYWFHSCGQ